MKQLQQYLKQIDGKSYKAYKQIQGTYSFERYDLMIDYVQGDPFAAPSKIRIRVPDRERKIRGEWIGEARRRFYAEDTITRAVAKTIHKTQTSVKGSGKSGMVAIDQPGQEILERTAVSLRDQEMIICLTVGLPANGRRINGKQAEKLFFSIIPEILKQSVFSIKDHEIESACRLADQHQAILNEMKKNDWISFIADESILPRESGVSQRPMKGAVPFQSPEENRVSIEIPHREEPLSGMALKRGIVLIVGGGYHGKSTLLNAIERGVYPHIVGDGREYVLTNPSAVKVRAEDGRQVSTVDISPFIKNLPHGTDTTTFSTENASGSTSQAANVIEALEAGASSLLIDEDTSATNFMIRDERMQELVVKEKEPITPFIDKIKQMRDELGVSTILVMGGSGDYFNVADDVIMMDQYSPYNVTEKAKHIAGKYPNDRIASSEERFGRVPKRSFAPQSLQTRKGKKEKVQAKGMKKILMGREDIALDYVEQLVDASQTRLIADLLLHLDKKGVLKQGDSLKVLLDKIEDQFDREGLASFAPFRDQHPGELARPRRFEIAAALNRIRTAKVKDIR
ncbi:ABC-ATPase domain-containing protein [Halobacillus karajensis]|uniref:ATPase of the ABC class n=1 Tax=Halobacillus karajensis TaxID=195088 RepID=A0A024P796_9BACI|nr:ABC-ATPase domain-containing protein [Halobacillus karajensis]CDQ21206.1 putative ATPase of the ABC class [Halobacillus karajensis]CDQ24730.1 putative ATPase of the ABC class [Halobacillus karajensis]CDQ28910.1 putative ATPase of the ABC class [Halobacillus karajensis]